MFSYYGSKSKIVDYYPPPKYGKIIEPFAGSARYSLKYFDRDILLVDKYENVIKVWKWLQQCSKNDILKFPRLEKGMDIRKMDLSDVERIFMSFLVASGRPSNIVTKFMDFSNGRENTFKNIANNLDKIRHWEIRLGSYDELENVEATWFIDPPYQFGGHEYKHSNKKINFTELAEWCKTRNGQAIVCENTKADWLNFKPVVEFTGTQKLTTVEAIWSNIPTNYDCEQTILQF